MSELEWDSDPTHGRIDRDIQDFVIAVLQPDRLGQKVALENSLQAKRNLGHVLDLEIP